MDTKFIHCADLHLGCTPSHLEERFDDFFESFKDVIITAIANKCKYILIAGDLFHLKVINSKTLLKVVNLFELAITNNIKIIAIEGNHDKAFYVDEDSWLEFLKEKNYITLLKHKIVNNELIIDSDSIYEDDYIRIIGISYLGSTTKMYLKDINKKISKSDKFTVLMLHAGVNKLHTDMGEVNIETLLDIKNVDYIALGHIHTRYEYENLIYNPGALENIRISDARNSGQKGYYLVSFNDKDKDVKYIDSKLRKTYNLSIEINFNSLEDANNYLKAYDYNFTEGSVVELTLCGKTDFNPYLINQEELKEFIISKYNILYIEINNLINIMRYKDEENLNVDISILETKVIEQFIKENRPELNNIDETKTIKKLKDSIINKVEIETIIKSLLEGETK